MNREFDTLFSRSVHPASHVKLTPTCPLDNLLSARQLQSSKLASAHIQSLRIRRRHTPPRLLIISLPHAVVSSCQLFCGKLRTEPATKQLDESFAPIPNSAQWFARQHVAEPPPDFRLASLWSGIARCFSGPSDVTLTHILRLSLRNGRRCGPVKSFPPYCFHYAFSLESGFLHPNARNGARLLGSCYKTRRLT